MKNRFLAEALRYIPQILQLVDRNPYSQTYGCFDREYWHYKTLDFPCGMSQEMVLPLAILYKKNFPGNKYYNWERLSELAVAGIRFAIKSSHPDGSCDDYFPYEQAMGALVFSTYAFTETYLLLGLEDEEMVDFFKRRGELLIKKNETGQLANHQALAALAAYNIFKICDEDRYRTLSEERVALTLSWQHSEGWFQEYEGADPGYHTCTIDFLAKLFQKNHDPVIKKALLKAIDFAWYFIHPDGSYGGEYGSRNTYHFYPHGFEIMAPYSEKAIQINDSFLHSLTTDKRYHNCDNRMVSHTVYNWLQAYSDFFERQPKQFFQRENFTKWMPGCGIVVVKKNSYYCVANLNKGGVFKAFNDMNCIESDTGLIGELKNGKTIVNHLIDTDRNVITPQPHNHTFSVDGCFFYRPNKLSSPLKLIIFRIINLTIGRFYPNLLRLAIQKLLITNKNRTSYRFSRTLKFHPETIEIVDEIKQPIPIKRLSIGSDATSIYVANSNVYQESVVRIPWQHAGHDIIKQLNLTGIIWKRTIDCKKKSTIKKTSTISPSTVDKSQKEFWSRSELDKRRHPEHPVITSYVERKISFIKQFVPINKQTTLLDVGCGNGFFTFHFDRICQTTGIDSSEKMLSLNPVKKTLLMDATNLTFPDNSFDIVFCHALLHHIKHFDHAISEMRRVTKQFVVILEPNRNNPLMFLFSALIPEERLALRFSLDFLKETTRQHNLNIIASFSQGILVPNKTPTTLLPILEKFDKQHPLGMTNFIIAKKS